MLNLGERLLVLDSVFEMAFAPAICDVKVPTVSAWADASLDLCLFAGAVRTTADEEMARLLRRKSRVLVALGSCAEEGCIPALANLTSVGELLESVFVRCPGTDNYGPVRHQVATGSDTSPLALPALCESVRTLDQVVGVEYTIPGCPPEPDQLWSALEPLMAGLAGEGDLPPPGAVLGAAATALCDECALERAETSVERFYRLHERVPEANRCLLEQGLVCLGVATRGGCGALCPRVGIPCRGCYGRPEGVEDQGAKMVAAVAAALADRSAYHDEAALTREIEAATAAIVDPVGTFYRFSLARSLLGAARPSRRTAAIEGQHENSND